MLIIGLTGGIGCGKTTITDIFKSLGAPIVDADEIAHQLVQPHKEALTSIVKTFGEDILNTDHTLDRNKLRQIIYTDPSQKKILENILHPLIYKEMQQQISTYDFPYGILSIPLLLETKHQNNVDRILVIDCQEQAQINRVMQRDNLSANEVQQIMQNQCSRSERLGHADDVIENTQGISSLKKRVQQLHAQYLSG